MSEPNIIHNTFVIERNYPNAPEAVFSAFSDPGKKRQWYAESNTHTVEEFEMNCTPGGTERFRYRFNEGTPFPGVELASEGTYCDVVPNQRIVFSSTMSLGGRRISVTLVTLEFLPEGQGTSLICTHQGVYFENSGGPKMREGGWRKLFDNLATDLTS